MKFLELGSFKKVSHNLVQLIVYDKKVKRQCAYCITSPVMQTPLSPVKINDSNLNVTPCFERLLGLMFTLNFKLNSYTRTIAKDAGKMALESFQKVSDSCSYILFLQKPDPTKK